jgi:anti-sigma regulatory factor (Ser/Thr protein kinase)
MTADSTSGGNTETISLPARSDSVPAVRRWARAVLARWGADDLEWITAQLLTEVATNAVLHARTAFEVRLDHDPDRRTLRCAVTDSSPMQLRVRHHSLESATGRGLRMLEELAAGWGVRAEKSGKTVWFEVADRTREDAPEPDLDALLLALDPDESRRRVPQDAGDVGSAGARPPVTDLLAA